MELVQKAKNALVNIFTKKEDKLDILLSAIDSITVNKETNMIHIKTAKNLAIENDGHMVVVNSGMQVLLSKQIHLNPRIDFGDANFTELKPRLDEARRLEQIEHEKNLKEIENHHKDCNH